MTQRSIEISVSTPAIGSAYDRCIVAYDPDARRIYTFLGVGAGAPEAIYRGQHPSISADVTDVAESLAAWAEKHAERFVEIAAAEGEERGELLDELQRLLSDAEQYGDVQRRWSASDWFAGDPRAVVEGTLSADSLEAAVESEVEQAASQGVAIDTDDTERELRRLLEQHRKGLNLDDEDGRAARARIAALLGERDEELERAEREALLWGDDGEGGTLAGVEVEAARGVVRVRDGADTWLCRESEWDAMVERVRDGSVGLRALDDEEAVAENYGTICGAVGGPILTLIGTPRGTDEERAELLGAAIAADLLEGIDPERYGVDRVWPEGARVEGGQTPDDYDVGSVYYDGGRLMVAWDSGVSTPADAGSLRPEGTRPIR